MSYAHSFAPDFYGDPYNPTPDGQVNADHPTTVCEAIMAIPKDEWVKCCREVFDCEPDYVDLDTVLTKIHETNTVSNLDSPVTVWIDEDGWWTVDVYDPKDKENES